MTLWVYLPRRGGLAPKDGFMQPKTYIQPRVRDYGTLVDLTAAVDVHFLGVVSNVVMAAISNPLGVTDSGHTGGVLGSQSGGGGGAGGGGGLSHLLGGGGGGKLPFTGFPVAFAAAVGAAMTAAGATLRAILRRKRA